jgi:hypothetical protein
MPKNLMTRLPLLLAAVLVGCASADDAADEQAQSPAAAGEPSASATSEGSGAGSGTARAGIDSSEPTQPESSAAVAFAADILPILSANCGTCHAAGILPRFAASDPDGAYAVALSLSDEIVSRLGAGTMPPTCSRQAPGADGCISVADYEEIERWVEDGAPE